MLASYKRILDKKNHNSNIELHFNNMNEKDLDEDQLFQVCKNKNIPTPNDLEILYNYCIKSSIDNAGINVFLFKLIFCSNIDHKSNKILIHTLMKTCQAESFDVNQFLNSVCINCLINHIINNDQCSKYAQVFLINLLYKTDKRYFLKETEFFNLFEARKNYQNLDDLIFAFFSHADEIDQEIFNKLSECASKCVFSMRDIHKVYRFLVMILTLAEKNIKIENIDQLIINNLKSNEDFMIEINFFLIQFSENPQNFFDYMISNFRNKLSKDAIIKASIRTFYFCWDKFSHEQKGAISNAISLVTERMSYSLRYLCVLFICNVKDWTIFNNIIFFEEIFNLITQEEIALNCLEAIYSFLSSDIQNDILFSQVINLLFTFYEDLTQISYSLDEPQSRIAQILINLINGIVKNNDNEI